MPDEPRPGMPQEEKDRLGAELRAAQQREERLARSEVVADDQLERLTKDHLLEEADRRGVLGVLVRASDTKPQILAALRGQASEQAEQAPAPSDQREEG
jgi:hypothetical protein